MRSASLFFLILAVFIISKRTLAASENEIIYVPIGDSYTIGEGARPEESWPALLAKHLNENGIPLKLVANPARTGWTTQDAINDELSAFESLHPYFSTLLIGVNDWVQGVDAGLFRQRLSFLMDKMLETLGDKENLLIVTIPDFSVTPAGSLYADGRNVHEGIAAFNAIIKEEAAARKLSVIDIYPLSGEMKNDSSLIAKDGLHPSAKEYALWEKLIYPVTHDTLSRKIHKEKR